MRTVDWLIIGGIGVGVYLWWRAQAAIGLTWTLSGISPSLSGLATVLNVSMLVNNSSSSAVTMTNVNATLYYQGSALSSGGGSFTINPGMNTVTLPFAVNDLTILGDIDTILSNAPASVNFQIKGTGLLDNVPVPFSTTVTVPTTIGSVRPRRKLAC